MLDPVALKEMVSQLQSIKYDLDVVGKQLQERAKTEGKETDEEVRSNKLDIKFSRTLIQPTTRLRKNVSEAIDAQENPEMQSILDRLSDIFR